MPNVLVVDDEDEIRSLLRLVLERDGFSVWEASNGVDALTQCRESPPDLILTDLLMPQMDGAGFLDTLGKLDIDCKVIVMSGGRLGKGPNSQASRAEELGADGFVAKPFDPTKMGDLCRAVLDRKDPA